MPALDLSKLAAVWDLSWDLVDGHDADRKDMERHRFGFCEDLLNYESLGRL